MNRIDDKNRKRLRRRAHVRKSIFGTSSRPRISVFRSNSHMYLQLVDDENGKVLVSASTVQKDYKGLKNTVEDAQKLGEAFGKQCVKLGVKEVVYDRNGYIYHGVVKSLADGARSAGLQF